MTSDADPAAADEGTGAADRAVVVERLDELLAAHPPGTVSAAEFLGAQFDAGLADVAFPVGSGGLDLPGTLQQLVTERLYAAGAPNAYFRNPIGVGHAAPTLVHYGTDEQRRRLLRPMFTGEDIWCQLFSEPGAGSDLAGLSTRAVRDGGDWVVTGQKVWTSVAHVSSWAMLLARTDPDAFKHKGLTYFIVDMHAPGVEVRPLRQLTGDAEFNEVFLDGVRIPDSLRLGEVDHGWTVAITTLMNERVAMGGNTPPRGSGLIGEAVQLWHDTGQTDPGLLDRLTSAWIRAEAQRLTNIRARQTGSSAGPEGAIGKLNSTEISMEIYDIIFEMLGPRALVFEGYDHDRPSELVSDSGGLGAGGYFTDSYELVPGGRRPLSLPELRYGYLRSRANGIEAGSSQIMRTVLAERVLGLPRELRVDRDRPWREIPRGVRGSDLPA